LQHPRSLSDCQPDARPTLDFGIEDFARLVERITGPQHPLDTLIVLGPLFDLTEVAIVGEEWVIDLFSGPIDHRDYQSSSASRFTAGADGFLVFSQ
jgi:hypothetical protein